MEKIADVLNQKHARFNTVTPDTTVYNALHKMYCENVDYLIVLDDEKFVGLLSDHDVATKILFAKEPLTALPVNKFMTTAFPVSTPDESIDNAMQLLEHHQAKFLVVYDEFEFEGIISVQDLMRQALAKRSYQPEVENAYAWVY